jgi:pectinesterase
MIASRKRAAAILLAAGALSALARGPAAADAPPPAGSREFVVAADGSGQYRSVQAAVDALPARSDEAVTIRVKPGTYAERVDIPRDRPPIRLVGEDAAKTVLIFNLHARTLGPDGRPLGTMRSSSTTVRANDFVAENVTFANSTPRDTAQALALAADGDRQAFRRCRFLGWQDTLYVGAGRKYFEECYVEGGVDFIFGPATAVFQGCEVCSKRHGYVTAASTPQDAAHGLVFLGCRLTAAADLPPRSAYLGRPWRDHACVTFLDCELGAHVRPQGWHNWDKPEREKTARFAEYGSTGPGAAPEARVAWARQLGEREAKSITPRAVLRGKDDWDPAAAAAGKNNPR